MERRSVTQKAAGSSLVAPASSLLSLGSIHEIPPEEIALAIKNLVRDCLSIERDTLLIHVARIFGSERAGTLSISS
jgi:hypothetical protein